MKGTLLLSAAVGIAQACGHIELHPEYQSGLSINSVPAHRRDHWMRVANEAIYEDDHPCPQAPFGTAIVDTVTDELICVAANKVGATGDPTMHGEITTIRRCTEALAARGMTPQQILGAWKNYSLYTNGEPCPMCMSAIRWAGFKEVIYGTSIAKIAEMGRNQIYIPSSYVLQKSYSLGHQTLILGNILTNETDVLFGHQFNESAPCPLGCERKLESGQRVSQCVPQPDWKTTVKAYQTKRDGKSALHDEL